MSSHAAVTIRVSASIAAASGRREQEALRLDNLQEIFQAEDSVQSLSLEQIKDKLSTECALPSGFQVLMTDDYSHLSAEVWLTTCRKYKLQSRFNET
jgi:hypothetical protein